MPRFQDDDESGDEWDEEFDDESSDTFETPFDDADEPTIACPYCGVEVHEDSPRCPSCENYLSREEVSSSGLPTWMIVGAVLAFLAMLTWLIF